MPFLKLNDVFAGRYQLIELLGEGALTELWKAKDRLAEDSLVVLKVYEPGRELKEEHIRQFSSEFARYRHLSHPQLLKASHFDVWQGMAYLIMPYCFKESLSSLLKKQGTLSEKQVAMLFCQIGSALEALHRQEPPILHQDVKPDNIVVTEQGEYMLANFSISTQSSPGLAASVSRPGLMTSAYAPPESFDPLQKSNASGDIFSFGLTVYQMCTNTLPWDGAGGQSLLKGEELPALPDHYSADLNKLLQACMSVSRRERPAADELQRRGREYLQSGHWSFPEERKRAPRPIQKYIPHLLATGVLALLLLGAFWAYQQDLLTKPLGNIREMGSSREGDSDEEIDRMILALLEEEQEEMNMRSGEAETESSQQKGGDAENSALHNNQDAIQEKRQIQSSKGARDRAAANSNRENVSYTTTTTTSAPAPKARPAAESSDISASRELEKQLNKVSDPAISGKERHAWKNETMALFAEDVVKILDETNGTPKQYSAGIFLNLLSKVPHTIVVKEVKKDQQQKVTELRLTMQETNM